MAKFDFDENTLAVLDELASKLDGNPSRSDVIARAITLMKICVDHVEKDDYNYVALCYESNLEDSINLGLKQ